MDFIEISVRDVDGEAAETVSELFNRHGHGGAVMESYPPYFDRLTVRTVIPADEVNQLDQIKAMLSLIGRALPNGLPEPGVTLVGQDDWAESWKANFHPVRVGQRFVIKPTWSEYETQPTDILIDIDPGMAFGTGLHPTTQLCLEILEQIDVTEQSFFDVGTGSGILAIAAAKLGASLVRAVDVDPVAVRVAEENFKQNGLTEQIEVEVGSVNRNGGQHWQIVSANILAHILSEIMPSLAAVLTPGGRLILSGMIVEQEVEIQTAVATHKLEVISRHVREDWVALVVTNPT